MLFQREGRRNSNTMPRSRCRPPPRPPSTAPAMCGYIDRRDLRANGARHDAHSRGSGPRTVLIEAAALAFVTGALTASTDFAIAMPGDAAAGNWLVPRPLLARPCQSR